MLASRWVVILCVSIRNLHGVEFPKQCMDGSMRIPRNSTKRAWFRQMLFFHLFFFIICLCFAAFAAVIVCFHSSFSLFATLIQHCFYIIFHISFVLSEAPHKIPTTTKNERAKEKGKNMNILLIYAAHLYILLFIFDWDCRVNETKQRKKERDHRLFALLKI